MKKVVCIAVMAMLGLGSLSAQERSKGEIEVIPFIGYQKSFFNGDYIDRYEPKTSFTFGLNGDYFFNDRWSLRSGLSYDTMGAAPINGFRNDVELNYLSIPINANWHFGSTRKWSLNFGLSASFLLSTNKVNPLNFKDEVKPFQAGFSYGIGYKLKVLESFSILFDAQGLVGITNFNNHPEGEEIELNARSYLGIGGVFVL